MRFNFAASAQRVHFRRDTRGCGGSTETHFRHVCVEQPRSFFMRYSKPPQPVHIPGTTKGEELTLHKGKEPGRKSTNDRNYRSARDSTGIEARRRRPIHPSMPSIPPA
jgi:hypothetical protein